MERAADLYLQAEAALEELQDTDGAMQLYAEACRLDPENEVYLSALASLYAEEGQQETAVHLFKKAVERFPDGLYEKFAYLGQMLEGEEAMRHDSKALELLRRDLSKAESSGKAHERRPDELKKLISSVLTSMAEKLLSSDRPVVGISAQCEQCLREARQADPSNAEPIQVLASLRSEQGRPEEALKWLRLSMHGWSQQPDLFMPEAEEDKDGTRAALLGPGMVQQPHVASVDPLAAGFTPDDSVPSFEFRFETAKLLLELDESTEAAAAVCKALVMENGEALDAWYLWALSKFASCKLEAAHDILSEASEAVEKLVAQQKADPADPAIEAIMALKAKVEGMMVEEGSEDRGSLPME